MSTLGKCARLQSPTTHAASLTSYGRRTRLGIECPVRRFPSSKEVTGLRSIRVYSSWSPECSGRIRPPFIDPALCTAGPTVAGSSILTVRIKKPRSLTVKRGPKANGERGSRSRQADFPVDFLVGAIGRLVDGTAGAGLAGTLVLVPLVHPRVVGLRAALGNIDMIHRTR